MEITVRKWNMKWTLGFCYYIGILGLGYIFSPAKGHPPFPNVGQKRFQKYVYIYIYICMYIYIYMQMCVLL